MGRYRVRCVWGPVDALLAGGFFLIDGVLPLGRNAPLTIPCFAPILQRVPGPWNTLYPMDIKHP